MGLSGRIAVRRRHQMWMALAVVATSGVTTAGAVGAWPSIAAASTEAMASSLAAAGVFYLRGGQGNTQPASVVAYVTPAGTTEAVLTACSSTTGCKDYSTISASLVKVGDSVELNASFSSIGSAAIDFGPGGGHGVEDGCTDTGGWYAWQMQGADVEDTLTSGTIGPWQVVYPQCAAWGVDAAIEYTTTVESYFG